MFSTNFQKITTVLQFFNSDNDDDQRNTLTPSLEKKLMN